MTTKRRNHVKMVTPSSKERRLHMSTTTPTSCRFPIETESHMRMSNLEGLPR
uniref:Uncharacterized protein n=1 Tax=Arundo donax TaxID=35708 RepID=A0A0A8YJI1_ARUDO